MNVAFPDVNIPTDGPTGFLDKIMDWQNWDPRTWAVLGGLLLVMVALYTWNRLDDKIKLLGFVVLIAIAALYFAS